MTDNTHWQVPEALIYAELPKHAATGLGEEYESFDQHGKPMGKAYQNLVYYTEDQMRAFADATCAMRASQGQAPAQAAPTTQPAPQQDVSAAGGDSFLLLPTRPTPDAPANTAGLSWDAYSGAQMLAYGRSCSDAALVVAAPSPASHVDTTDIVDVPDQCPYFGQSPHRDVWLEGWYAACATQPAGQSR